MTLAHTKAEGLALLSQFFLTGMSACQSIFHGHAEILHISLPLFNFVARGAFANHGNHLACPSRGISPWTSLQGMGDRGEAVASTLSDIGAQDSRPTMTDSVTLAPRDRLSALSRQESWAPMSERFDATASPLSPMPWREVHGDMPLDGQARWLP